MVKSGEGVLTKSAARTSAMRSKILQVCVDVKNFLHAGSLGPMLPSGNGSLCAQRPEARRACKYSGQQCSMSYSRQQPYVVEV